MDKIIGLSECRLFLKEWFEGALTDPLSKIMLMIGPTGCGKSMLVHEFCTSELILLHSVNLNDSFKTKKDIIKDILNFIDYSNTNFFNNCKKGKIKKLILIDEYQSNKNSLLSITDINNLLLIKKNKTVELPPILIISSDSRGSKLGDLKKNTIVYYIKDIPPEIIKSWILELGIPDKDLDDLISRCGSDKRLLLNTINFLKQSTKNGNINLFINSFYKDADINLLDFTDELFKTKVSLNSIHSAYKNDGYKLCNLVHENYLDYSDDIDSIAKSADSISFAETIFSDIYDSGKPFNPETHCIFGLMIPSYYSRKDVSIVPRTSCINNRFNIYLNNKKFINQINLDIFDIFFIKSFLNQNLVKTKILNECQNNYLRNLLKNITIENLELIYKHFNIFNEPLKTKNFTLKFKQKLNILSLN